MKKIFNSRFFSVVILLVVICTLFTACGGAKQVTVQKTVAPTTGTSFTPQQLNEIATTLYNNPEARDAFLAAYRGYDVIDGKYDENTDFSVIEVSAVTGFNNVTYFNRLFKEKYGATPTEYRS